MDGKPSKWVTETESEFDVNERDSWYAKWEYEAAICPQCGRLRSVCEDPATPWYPQRSTCWASAAQEVVLRKLHDKHEKSTPDGAGYLPTDGVSVWVSDQDLTPDDNFLD